MKKELSTEKHLDYFTNKLLEYVLSNCSPNTVSVKFIRERAKNATQTYFSIIKRGKTSVDAHDKALKLLYWGINKN